MGYNCISVCLWNMGDSNFDGQQKLMMGPEMWLWTSNVMYYAEKYLCRVYSLQSCEKGLEYQRVW